MEGNEKLKDSSTGKLKNTISLLLLKTILFAFRILFTKQQDIEIAGLFAALFAWGNRTTIINKSKELMDLMGNEPYSFCIQAIATLI